MIESRTIRTIDGKPSRVWKNPVSGEQYRCMVAGVSWPAGGKQGSVVVMAEARFPENGAFKISTLFHFDAPTVPRLYRTCVGARAYYQVAEFYGDPLNRAMHSIWMQAGESEKERIWITEAPQVREENRMQYYLQVIQGLLKPKRLYLESCNDLRGALDSLPSDVSGFTVEDSPGVAALGFAASSIVNRMPSAYQEGIDAGFQ